MGVNVGIVLDAEHPPERTKSIPKKKGLIDLVIDTDLATPFCILLGMSLVLSVIFAKVGNKGLILQRLACDLGRLAQKDCAGGDSRSLGKWF